MSKSTEFRRLRYVVSSRKWDVFATYKWGLDDNNARTSQYGLGWQCQGAHVYIDFSYDSYIINISIAVWIYPFMGRPRLLSLRLFNEFPACFRVFHRKNTTISFWTSWDFTRLELQIRRYWFSFLNFECSNPISFVDFLYLIPFLMKCQFFPSHLISK